jgi:ureidoglycolate lyase
MLKPEPLTKAAFSAFGDVVEIDGHKPLHINQGFALRFDEMPIVIDIMERHPLGSQLFYPLQDKPWLVVVCEDPTDVKTFRAFSAGGRQGISYHRNIWHFPLLVFENESRFIVVDRIGPGKNLEEVELANPFSIKL